LRRRLLERRPVAALVAIWLGACAHPRETKVSAVPATPATPKAASPSPSGSRVAAGIDAGPPDVASEIVVRAQLLEHEKACDKYCWARLKVLSVVGAGPRHALPHEIRVAHFSAGQGIPDGVSTICLAPYNRYTPSGLWRLVEDPGGKAHIATDAHVALAWGQALLSDVDPSWLAELTALPFAFRATEPHAPCQQDARTPDDLRAWSRCLNEGSDAFVEGLRWAEPRVVPGDLTNASPKLRKLAEAVTESGNWVLLTGDFNGFHSALLLRVRQQGSRKLVSAALGDVTLDAHGQAEVKRRASYASMIEAIDRGDARGVRRLIDEGAAVDDAGRDDLPGEIPIVAAAKKGDLAVVEVLLEAGANPNACCCSCVTALHRAIEKGHTAMVARLLDGGADPGLWYDGRMSTLELARRTGNREIVRRIEEALARTRSK